MYEVAGRTAKRDAILVFHNRPRHKHRFVEAIALTSILSNLAVKSGDGILRRELVEEVVAQHNGLRAILILNGFSMATLCKIVHLTRICDDRDLRKTLNYSAWNIAQVDARSDKLGVETIERLVQENIVFRSGIVNLFYEGATLSILHGHFPPGEIKKLSIKRMGFRPFSIIETLVDYGLYYEQAQTISAALKTLGHQLES